jgi:preprotein translocase subunit SecE
MSKINIVNFFEQVKQEMVKVTWPSKKETIFSTMMVIVMVTISSIFFLLVDMIVHNTIQLLLGIGN